jgi:hypothetical protein
MDAAQRAWKDQRLPLTTYQYVSRAHAVLGLSNANTLPRLPRAFTDVRLSGSVRGPLRAQPFDPVEHLGAPDSPARSRQRAAFVCCALRAHALERRIRGLGRGDRRQRTPRRSVLARAVGTFRWGDVPRLGVFGSGPSGGAAREASVGGGLR